MRGFMPLQSLRPYVVLVVTSALTSCGEQAPTEVAASTIQLVSARNDPTNVLSVHLQYVASRGDSIRVLYADASNGETETPSQAVDATGRALVLGLSAGTRYVVRVRLYDGTVTALSDTMSVTTGALPTSLQNTNIKVVDGHYSGGFNLTNLNVAARAGNAPSSAGGYLVAYDSAGVLRWYHRMSDGVPVREAKQQRNGDYTCYVGTATGSGPAVGEYVELTPGGEEVRRLSAPSPLYTDNHDMLMSFASSGAFEAAYFFSYDIRRLPPSRSDRADSLLAAHQLIRATPDGRLTTLFNAWDYFGLADRIEPPDLPAAPDIDHPNSLDFDRDGNFVVSWRNMGAVTKLDAQRGTIVWQLGGSRNQFRFVNDPFGGFSAQHSVRVTGDGTILVHDNGTRHNPPETRAVEYRLDTVQMTATMVWQFRHTPALYNPFQGSVQRLASGNTLMAFTSSGTLSEVAPDGSIVGDGIVMASGGETVGFYRVTRINSLYEWRAP